MGATDCRNYKSVRAHGSVSTLTVFVVLLSVSEEMLFWCFCIVIIDQLLLKRIIIVTNHKNYIFIIITHFVNVTLSFGEKKMLPGLSVILIVVTSLLAGFLVAALTLAPPSLDSSVRLGAQPSATGLRLSLGAEAGGGGSCG